MGQLKCVCSLFSKIVILPFWPDGVVVATPFLDQDLGFAQGVEELAVEEFTAEPGIEAFTVAVQPPVYVPVIRGFTKTFQGRVGACRGRDAFVWCCSGDAVSR